MGYDTDVARALKPPSKAPWLLVGLLGAAGAGGGYHFYDELQKAKSETRAATDKAAADVAAATAAQKELTDKVEKLEGEKAELATAKEELSKEVAAKSGELEQLKGTYDKLEEKMKDEIAKGDISLSQDGGRLRVGLVDKILFDSGEAADLQARRGGAGARGRGAGHHRRQADPGLRPHRPHADLRQADRPVPHQLGAVDGAGDQRRPLPVGEGQRAAAAPGRQRLQRVPPDRQQQDRGRPRQEPPHRDPADPVAGAQGDRQGQAHRRGREGEEQPGARAELRRYGKSTRYRRGLVGRPSIFRQRRPHQLC